MIRYLSWTHQGAAYSYGAYVPVFHEKAGNFRMISTPWPGLRSQHAAFFSFYYLNMYTNKLFRYVLYAAAPVCTLSGWLRPVEPTHGRIRMHHVPRIPDLISAPSFGRFLTCNLGFVG